MPLGVTNVAGCAIEAGYIYLAEIVDKYGSDYPFTQLAHYDAQNAATPWIAHDVHWRTVSVCVWRDGPYGKRVYVALSEDGDVEIVGPGDNPKIVEYIPGSGLAHPGALGQGWMQRVRQIGRCLYACGSGYLTFRRDADGWHDFTDPAVRDVPSGQWYFDINGHSEQAIYAVGLLAGGGSRASFFDGVQWRTVFEWLSWGSPRMTCVALSERGGVYIGAHGGLLYGDSRSGFHSLVSNDFGFDIVDMVEFRGDLYMATDGGLLVRNEHGTISPVQTGLQPELQDASRVDAVGGTLWSFGPKDVACFDGTKWTRVHNPDNPRIGR